MGSGVVVVVFLVGDDGFRFGEGRDAMLTNTFDPERSHGRIDDAVLLRRIAEG